jgi:protein phosphatase
MIRTDANHMLVTAQTHPGMTGKNNEDRYAVSTYRISASNPTLVTFAVVCDGIGGHRSGEVAAEIAVETILKTVANSFGDRPLKTMQLATQQANEAIYGLAQGDESKKGMGATCALVWVEGLHLYTTSIGDSRIYLLRGNHIRQLAIDHTWVQEALDNGTITPEQAIGHPNAHVIRRYLGAPVVPDADQRLTLKAQEELKRREASQGGLLKPGDIVLLCTDGLSDLVTDPEIFEILHAGKAAMPDAVNKLIQKACDHGGHDNITIVALTVQDERLNNPVLKLLLKSNILK